MSGKCCQSCEVGQSCEGEKAPVSALPPDLIIPGPEPDPNALLPLEFEAEPAGEDDASWAGRVLRPGAPMPVNTRLKLGHAETTVSDAMALGRCTSGSVDLVIFILNSLTTVEAILEGTIDGENFSRISSTVFSAAGYARFRFRNVTYRLIRLYYTATGSPGGIGIVASTINGSTNHGNS
jgi:hypothetical protein